MARSPRVPPTPRAAPARLNRFTIPEQLPGATAFSDEPDLYSVKQLIAFIISSAWLWRPLFERTADVPCAATRSDRLSTGQLLLADIHGPSTCPETSSERAREPSV